MKYSLRQVFILIFFAFAANNFAANRYWVSAGAGNWNTTASWSTSSAGSSGASVPGSSDVAIFDGAGGNNGNCTIDATVNVAGFTISGYTGTISQGANTITIGTSNFSQSSGTFTGGSSSITIIAGTFTLSGGTFTSTTDALWVGGIMDYSVTFFTHSGGTFNHNNGTVILNPGGCHPKFTIDVITSTAFYNVTLNSTQWCSGANEISTAAGDTVDVLNNFIQTDGWITGIFELKGNITADATADGGSGQIVLDGTGTQTYYGSGRTPYIVINKTAGVVNAGVANYYISGLAINAGTFNAPTGSLYISSPLDNYYNNYSGNIFVHSTGATFNHNNGTVIFDGGGCQIYQTIDIIEFIPIKILRA